MKTIHARWASWGLLVTTAVLLTGIATDALAGGGDRYGSGRVSAKEAAKIELGRRLFFDPLVSRSGERSCASCHDPEYGFSDPARVSEDDIGNTIRHSQTILDSALNPTAHWDGEFNSVEALVTARIGLPQGRIGSHGAPLLPSFAMPSIGTGQGAGFGEGTPSRRRGGGGGGYGGGTPSSPPPASGGHTPSTPRGGSSPSRPDTPDAAPAAAPGARAPESGGGEGDAGDEGGEDYDDSGDDASGGDEGGASDERRKPEEEKPVTAKELAKLPRVQDVLEQGGRYDEAFKAAFGNSSVTTARIAAAIGAYCRSVKSTESAYDRYAKGDKFAMSEAAVRGFKLFKGKAGCAKCHDHKAKHAPFTDFGFHNTGVSWLGLSDAEREELSRSQLRAMMDQGRERFTNSGRDRRAFKTPTLRDLTRRGPFMHDGRFETLDEVVRHYAAGGSIASGSKDPRQDKLLRPFAVTDGEVADLVAFLESLTGDERPGLAKKAWHARASTSRLRLVDGKGKPLVGMPVRVLPVGDTLPGDSRRTSMTVNLVSDGKGWIEYAPPAKTHVRLLLPNGLTPEGRQPRPRHLQECRHRRPGERPHGDRGRVRRGLRCAGDARGGAPEHVRAAGAPAAAHAVDEDAHDRRRQGEDGAATRAGSAWTFPPRCRCACRRSAKTTTRTCASS